MKSVSSMYFSDSINKIHHNRITKQLEIGNKKMKKDIHVIIIKEDGENLFEYLELDGYMKLYEVTTDFIIVGAVTSYTEFTVFVTDFINKCLNDHIPIEKPAIIQFLLTSKELT